MTWIWTSPDVLRVPIIAEYHHEASSFDLNNVLEFKAGSDTLGTPSFRVNYGSKRVRKLNCLPTTVNVPVVSEAMQRVINAAVGSGDVQYYPVKVETRDGSLDGYSFVIPLRRVICADIERSQITKWIIPGKYAYGYRSLVIHPSCLGGAAIVRDIVTNLVVISERLKNVLAETEDSGLEFTRPEDMRSVL